MFSTWDVKWRDLEFGRRGDRPGTYHYNDNSTSPEIGLLSHKVADGALILGETALIAGNVLPG